MVILGSRDGINRIGRLDETGHKDTIYISNYTNNIRFTSMSKIEAVGEVVKKVGDAIDNNSESGEERQEALSHRHEMDMVNGTWLTKNIRPLTLLTLLFYWLVLLPVLLSFGVTIPDMQIDAVEMLSLAAFTFYFGSKGFEKVQVIKAKSDRKEKRLKRKDRNNK